MFYKKYNFLFSIKTIQRHTSHETPFAIVPDYDLQTGLMEALCRMATPYQRKDLADRWFSMEHVAKGFSKIRDSEFETVKIKLFITFAVCSTAFYCTNIAKGYIEFSGMCDFRILASF